MSYLNSGLLSTYNSLTDKHLAGYFSNTRIRKHLRRSGLITRSGRIVSDKEYRLKLVRRDHQRHVRECLAQAIFHKVLNMEMERSKRCDEDIIPLLSPKPPSGPRNGHKESPGPEEEHLESSESPGSSRPNTAPGKMLRPHWLQPIHRNKTSVQTSPGCRHQDSSDNSEQLLIGMDKDLRSVTVAEYSRGTSPYQLPLINFSSPVPPSIKRTSKGSPNRLVRGRRLRPTTAPNIPALEKDSKFRKTSVHSNVSVTMVYYGKSVHLSHEDMDKRDEVKVFQQHCGGENLCVYKGKLMEEETFQFVSRRHQGFPFSLTFFLNGMQVDRLSSCCEFKHRVGSRLGGKHGHFGFIGVNGSSPCYKCIISMGLDKMPTPPKRSKEDMAKGIGPDNSQEMAKEAKEVEQDIQQEAQIHLQSKPRKEQNEDESMETQAKDIDEDKANDDYNDDFDADDERGDEDMQETKPTVKDSSSSSDRRDSQVDKDDDGTVNHQREDEDKYSGSELEEDVVAEDKKSPSCSYRGSPTRSREDSDSEAEEVSEAVRNEEGQLEKEEGQLPEELPQTEIPACADEEDHHGQGEQKEEPDDHKSDTSSPTPRQTTAGTAVGDTEAHETEREGTGSSGLELLDGASVTHPQEGQEVGKSDAELNGGDNEAKPEECSGDSEPERAKSVQEILAEAIMEEVQSSPEPELSDTSTEEEDLPSEIKTAEQKSTGEQDNQINAEMKDEKTENTENMKEQKERIVKGENMSEFKGLQAQESVDCSQVQEVLNGEEHSTETDDTTKVEKNGLKETESQEGESRAQSEATREKEDAAEEIEAQPEETEAVAEMIEAHTNEAESQENESEVKAEGTDMQEKETGAEQTEAHSRETESQGIESEAKVEETYTQAAEPGAEHTEAQSNEDDSQGNESEAKVEGAEALKKETKEQDREAEGQSNVSETQPEVTEAETEITEAHGSETESQENKSVAKVEETAMLERETGEELIEADSKETEAQENESEAPMEGAETQEKETDEQEKETKERSNVSEPQPEVIEAETEMIEAHTNESESKSNESAAKEVEGTDTREKEIRSENTDELAERTAVRATVTGLKTDGNGTQAVGNENRGRGTEAKETEEHKEIEAQAENLKTELPEAQKEGNEDHTEIIVEGQEEMLTEKTEVLGKEPAAEDTKVPAKQTERRVNETEAEESESKVTEPQEGKAEAQEEQIEAPPEGKAALEANIEAPAERTEGPENKSEAQMEGTDGQEEERREEGIEGLEEGTDCKTEGDETQAAGTDTQGMETEENTKVAEARVETKDSNVEGSKASTEGNEARTDTEGAKAQKDDAEIWEKWTISWKESHETRTEVAETKAEVNEALMKVNESGRSGAHAQVTEEQTGNLDTRANIAGDRDKSMSKTADDNEEKSEQQDTAQDKVETQDESLKVKDNPEENSDDSSGKYVSAANDQKGHIEQKRKEVAKYENNDIDKNDEIGAKRKDLEKERGNDLEHKSKDEVKRNEEETRVTYENLEEKEAVGKDFDDDLREADTKTEDREEIMKLHETVASDGSKSAKSQRQGYIKNTQLNTEQETAKFGGTETTNGSKLKEHVMTGGTGDRESQSIADGGDEQVSEVFDIEKPDAKDEGKDESSPTGKISREGDFKVEDPGKEAMANHDQGGSKPERFETGSKGDVSEMTAADVEAGSVFEDGRPSSEEKRNKSNLLQSDGKDCAEMKTQKAADEFSNKSRSSVLEERRGNEENEEDEYKTLEPKISEQRKSEETTHEQRPDVSLTAKLIKPVMQMQGDRVLQINDDDGEQDHFKNGTKEYAVSGKPVSEDTKTGSKATPEELTSDQKSISSTSDRNRDAIKVKSRVAEGKDGDCVVEIEHCGDDVEVKEATEGLLDGRNERTGTSHVTEEKVAGTFTDDSIVQDVVQEDENDADKPGREFAVGETAIGEEAKVGEALKSQERQQTDKIMHLEHDTTIKAGTNDELMKTEAEEDVLFGPEALVKDGSGDLVTSWVNKHQASRYFQTFTEPIEDLKGFSGNEESEKKMAHTK